MKGPSTRPASEPANRVTPAPETGTSGRRSLTKGDVPTSVLDRYLIERDRQGRPQRYFRDNRTKTPTFRDHGRSLSTGQNYPDAVSDMLKVARHRGWDQIRTSGDEGFRREVWVQANALGMQVKGYRPTERDRQAAGPAPIAHPQKASSKPAPDRDAASTLKRRMDMATVVVRALISDPAAQARLLEGAWARVASRTAEDRKRPTPDRQEAQRRRDR